MDISTDLENAIAEKKPSSVAPGRVDLLGVCTSMKPAPGYEARSAARQFLRRALGELAETKKRVGLIDLRELPLPLFDGRLPEQIDSKALDTVRTAIDQADTLLLSVPCYWGGISGVFKNFIDVCCGPIYDLPAGTKTIFTEKVIGLFVVGADEESANCGADQASNMLRSTGAVLPLSPVILANPRLNQRSSAEIIDAIVSLGRGVLR